MGTRKENTFIKDDELSICRITTALTKKLNKDKKLWKVADIEDIEPHEYEAIISNDDGLVDLLKNDYLVFYDSANDIRRSNAQNPKPSPFENVGYFWAINIHTKARIPLGRLVWQYKHGREIPHGLVVDHGNDMNNLCTYSNLSLLTQQQNIGKLRYPKRIVEPYSITMVSHPDGLPIKLLRFKDDDKKEQELLIYNVENGIEPLLDDLNSFKNILYTDTLKFKQHFEYLIISSRNYMAYMKQTTTGDSFADEIFSYSIDWQKINEIVRVERFAALAG